jgi:hypothetical protein
MLGFEADQVQLRVVLAAFEPGRDELVPQAIDHRAVVVDDELALDRGEQLMTLGREVQRRPMRMSHRAREIGVVGREKPDGTARVFVVQDLRGHRLAVAVLATDEAEHGDAIAGEGFPEFRFDFGIRHKNAPR